MPDNIPIKKHGDALLYVATPKQAPDDKPLGVVLHELFTGFLAESSEDFVTTSWDELPEYARDSYTFCANAFREKFIQRRRIEDMKLESELASAKAHLTGCQAHLHRTQEAAITLQAKLHKAESELASTKACLFQAQQAAISYQDKLIKVEELARASQEDSNEWTDWPGGECPVSAGTLVDVEFRDGTKRSGLPALRFIGAYGASHAYWDHGTPNNSPRDIIKWRLHKPKKGEA